MQGFPGMETTIFYISSCILLLHGEECLCMKQAQGEVEKFNTLSQFDFETFFPDPAEDVYLQYICVCIYIYLSKTLLVLARSKLLSSFFISCFKFSISGKRKDRALGPHHCQQSASLDLLAIHPANVAQCVI